MKLHNTANSLNAQIQENGQNNNSMLHMLKQ